MSTKAFNLPQAIEVDGESYGPGYTRVPMHVAKRLGIGATMLPEPGDKKAEPGATDGARELAEENGIDLQFVSGTGANGKIVKSDVEKVLARSQEAHESEGS